jgi:hypothetical protein
MRINEYLPFDTKMVNYGQHLRKLWVKIDLNTHHAPVGPFSIQNELRNKIKNVLSFQNERIWSNKQFDNSGNNDTIVLKKIWCKKESNGHFSPIRPFLSQNGPEKNTTSILATNPPQHLTRGTKTEMTDNSFNEVI